MIQRPPGKIIVEAEVAASPIVASLRSHLPSSEFQIVHRIPERRVYEPDVVEVVAFRGRLLKSCPGTRHYFCCGYRILHFGIQCSLGCSYCILQAYLNQPNLRLFGNTDEILKALSEELHSHPGRLYRIGTGEFTDSLLLDPWTDLSRQLVPFFSRQPNAVLELKTKTNYIENLADLDHGGRTIVAWSLNAKAIVRGEEPHAASLEERIKAARQCVEWGYWLAFHFDPMIEHEGWREGYGEVIDRLFAAVDPRKVVWVSLGALRFMPELKLIIASRHAASRILNGEFIRGLDGKMRYFRDIRVELYRFLVDRIREVDPGLCVYLCMEGRDVWSEALGLAPDEHGGLPAILDRAVKERMMPFLSL
jgi:spore photoproduct lyase